jgi:hypothetical protein
MRNQFNTTILDAGLQTKLIVSIPFRFFTLPITATICSNYGTLILSVTQATLLRLNEREFSVNRGIGSLRNTTSPISSVTSNMLSYYGHHRRDCAVRLHE